MATIVIGCGGSGLKTLTRLNQLLSENENWLNKISENVFYLGVDTEANALRDFNTLIENQVKGANKPCVRTVHLSEGVTILNEVVSRYFDQPYGGKNNDEGLERLKKEWWFQDDAPFRAPCVKDLAEGAGQCPPASRLLAWWRLPEIENTLRDIIEQVKLRHVGKGGNPLKDLKVYIASGLAGGTGRGCWGLIMKKIRHLLIKEYGIYSSPMAFFFDATAFDNLSSKYPDQEVFIKVNSLTGLSELSWWMANQKTSRTNPKDAYVFKLPSLATPATSTTDVLVMETKKSPNAAAPIDHAFLVCGGNTVGTLNNNQQYHEMVGAGLYAVITCDEIKRDFVNKNAFFHSMAASTFEVDASRLALYFESLVRSMAVKKLTSTMGDFSAKKNEFFKACPVLSGVTTTDLTAYMPEEKGTLLQRICHCLVHPEAGAFKDEMTGLAKALEADDTDAVFGIVDGLMEEPSETKVAEAVKSAWKTFKKNPADLLSEMMLDEYKKSKSLAQAAAFVQNILLQLENDMEQLPAVMVLDSKDDPQVIARRLAGREWGIVGPHFNNREQAEILQKTSLAILVSHYALIKEELNRLMGPIRDMFCRQVKAVEKMQEILKRLSAKFEAEGASSVGAKAGSDPYDTLFGSADRPEDSLPSDLDPQRYYKRVLKPVMPKEAVRSLVESSLVIREDLDIFLRGAIESCRADSPESLLVRLDSAYGPERFRKELEAKIRESVCLADDFMRKNFSFMHVVDSIKRAFESRLNKLSGDKNKRVSLERALLKQFGVTVEKDSDGNFKLPDPCDMLKQMAASLAAHCKPWWEMEGVVDKMVAVYVFLPEEVEDVSDFTAEVKGMVEATTVEVVDAKTKGTRANCYAIVAFASQASTVQDGDIVEHPLDKITSIRYWKEAAVEKWLARCEDPNGRSIFSDDDDNKGVGYLSPMYVKVDQVVAGRWRPWADEMVDEGNRSEQEAVQALLYAFLPMSADETVKKALVDTGWSLPLIKDAGSEKFVFTRRALKLDEDNTAEEDHTCGWDDGEGICTSVWQVLDFLAGKGKKGVDGRKGEDLKSKGVKWRQRILEEAQVFAESVAPRAGCTFASKAGKDMLKLRTKYFSAEKSEATADDAAVWDVLVNASSAASSKKKA